MRALTVLYLLFLAGALTGAGTPCRTALASWRSGRSVPDLPPARRRRRPRVRS